MSQTQIDSAKVQKAKGWCTKARELLGGGYYLFSSTASVEMHSRIEAVSTGLQKLESSNPAAYQRLGNDFRVISKEAKAAAQAKDTEGSERVSQQLEILRMEIQAEVSGLSVQQGQQLFELRHTFALDELLRLEQLADADFHRHLAIRLQDINSDIGKSRDYPHGVVLLKAETSKIQLGIKDWTLKLQQWQQSSSKRDQIAMAAEQLEKGSPFQLKVKQLLLAADDLATRVRDYDLAQSFVEQSEQVLKEGTDYEGPIRKTIQQFLAGDQAYLELCDQVRERLDRLLTAFTDKQRQRQGPLPTAGNYEVLGEIGRVYQTSVQLAQGYRVRAQTGSLEAWGGCLELINTASQQLMAGKLQLDKLLGGSQTERDNNIIDLIHDYQRKLAREELLQAWMAAKQKAQQALDKLAEVASRSSPEFKNLDQQLQTLLQKHDGVKVAYDPSKLEALASQVQLAMTGFERRREELQRQRLEVRDKWNELFEKRDVFPETYYDGISDEYDRLAIYLDSPNPVVVELGLQQRRELLDRFQQAINNPTQISQGAELFEKVKQQLAQAETDLASFQPSRFAQHQFVRDELAKTVHTEAPSTLIPKLENFEREVQETLSRVAPIKQLRLSLQQLSDELSRLYVALLDAYKRLNLPLPPEFKSSFEQVGERHLKTALSLEDLALAGEHRTRLQELKSELEKLLLSDQEIEQHYARIEKQHVEQENSRLQLLEQQRLEFERELTNFQSGLLKEVNAKLGRSLLATYLGQGDDRLLAINKTLETAKSHAKQHDYSSALKSLKVAMTAAANLNESVAPDKLNSSLAGLGRPWAAALGNVQQAATQVIAEINKICTAIKDQNPLANPQELITKIQVLSQVAQGLEASEFDGFLEKIQDPERSDRKAQAELALQLVRKRIKFVSADPLLQKLVRNPFKVKVPQAELLRALRNLELALQSVH